MKKILSGLTIIMMCLVLSACSTTEASVDKQKLSQKIRVNGSTSMEKLVNGLAEVIKEDYPNIVVEPQFTGSSAGIEALLIGSADIGTSSRGLKEEEKEKGVVENIVAIDGVVIITHPSNVTVNLTTEQLVNIYNGTIRNWKEVGGKDQNIVVLGREAGSGTRGAFEEVLDVEDMCKYAQEINETGAVVAKVASIPGAIGYVSLDVVNATVKTLNVDGVSATEDNIKKGKYSIQRPFVMATKGEIAQQSQPVQEMFAFLDSEAGQKLIKTVGLISAK